MGMRRLLCILFTPAASQGKRESGLFFCSKMDSDNPYLNTWDKVNVIGEIVVGGLGMLYNAIGMYYDTQTHCERSGTGLTQVHKDMFAIIENPKAQLSCQVMSISDRSSLYEGGSAGQLARYLFQVLLAVQKLYFRNTCYLGALAAVKPFEMSEEFATVWNCLLGGKKSVKHTLKEIWRKGWADGSIDLGFGLLRNVILAGAQGWEQRNLTPSPPSTDAEGQNPDDIKKKADETNWLLFGFNVVMIFMNFLRHLLGNYCIPLSADEEIKALDDFYQKR